MDGEEFFVEGAGGAHARIENPAVWDAVNDVARMIHDVDANHPATTMLAGVRKRSRSSVKLAATART